MKSFLTFGVALAVLGASATGLAPQPQVDPPSAVTPAQSGSTKSDRLAETIRGALFLEGPLGERLVDDGALGQFSSDQRAALEDALNSDDAVRFAREATTELLQTERSTAERLQHAIDHRDPVRTDALLRQLSESLSTTPAVSTAREQAARNAEAATYVPGETGPDCLFNVVVGGVLVLVVAAVAVGVVALASVAAVGSVKVAGSEFKAASVEQADGRFVASLISAS